MKDLQSINLSVLFNFKIILFLPAYCPIKRLERGSTVAGTLPAMTLFDNNVVMNQDPKHMHETRCKIYVRNKVQNICIVGRLNSVFIENRTFQSWDMFISV